ncbi:MAG: FtsX-like permease family protein [Patescibacteria group bacterium]
MWLIALRNLFGEKGRLIITIGGVSFAVMLILVLLGLYVGWERQMTKFLGNISADIWVGQAGSGDISHRVSVLPESLYTELGEKSYVKQVSKFIGRQVGVEIDGVEKPLYIIGLDEAKFVTPYKLSQGTSQPQRGEIIVDEVFINKHKLALGDSITVASKPLKIVGIATGGNIMVSSYTMVSEEDARAVLGLTDSVNYFLIRSDNPSYAITKLEKDFPNLKIMPRQEFLDNNAAIVKDNFLPIIGILTLIAFAVGIAVIGLTIFTAVIEKSREYGVLKAIGYGNGQLFGIALIQALIAGVLGFALGYALTPLVARLAKIFESSFIYELGSREILAVFIATILMSIIASFLPLRRLLKIDPAKVFKA